MHKLTDKLAAKITAGLPHFHSNDSYFHVVLSGNRRKELFATVHDRRALNAIAIETLHRFNATLHAYCLLSNHFRALVQIDDRLLIKALRRIAAQYSRHRQRHSKSSRHLFERPYTAQRIDTDGDFLNLLRCIHLNPVLANKVVAPADYLWSSHRAYLGYRSVAKITTDFGLSLFAASPAQARVAYHQFIADGLSEDFGRSVDRRNRAVGGFVPASHSLANATKADIPSSVIDSRIQLPRKIKPALRFGRERKRARSRRFLAIY
jgi:REP element-mobilizing transposase RayT